jgi:hypothetical protein
MRHAATITTGHNMRLTTRFIALGLASAMLVACAHKDKDAPLAFAPADTPYVLANLDTLDADTRAALLTQADAQLPSQLAQLNATADRFAEKDPDGARLLHALTAEFKGKTIETFAHDAGINLGGYHALYGIGLAPVARIELSDHKAFDRFVDRLETAYGTQLDVLREGGQSYRRHVFAASGTEVVLATQGKHAVLAVLPADASKPLLRQALGLDRPQKSLQDDGRLAKLAKTNGYTKYVIGQVDMTRQLPLLLGGKDPLLNALRSARAKAVSVKTGEPVANQLVAVPPSCVADASRIAARVPALSFGYTTLNAKHQDARLDIALATDISQAFADLKVALPGLGSTGTAPLDVSIALPIASLRTFWSAQVDAVAAKPFTCPTLLDLNDSFAKLGPVVQKAAIPPFGDLQGIRIALDSLVPANDGRGMPTFSGRLLVATTNAPGLFAMGQMSVPSLNQLKPAVDGTPLALTKDLTTMLGQPAWIAMTDKVLALGVGAGADAKLRESLKSPGGDAGRMARMHLSGNMYMEWLRLMEQKVDSFAAATAALTRSDEPSMTPDSTNDVQEIAADAARSKAQFAAMQLQAERILNIDAEMHVDDKGMVVTSQTTLK